MKLRLAIVTAMVVATSATTVFAGTAGAQNGFHAYSIAYETSDSSYSGIWASRWDPSLSPVDCVYMPIWTGDASRNSTEMGSEYGPGCVGVANTWYYGYQTNGLWHLGGTRALNPGQFHNFSIKYVGGWYYYYVDATNVYGRYYPHYFSFVTAGLESYDSTAHVLAFQDSALAYTTNGGGWKNWAGEDSTGMDGGVMCGHWVSATNWQAGEHSTPC